MKIRPVWEPIYSFRTDRRTDGVTNGRDEANGHFPRICERP